MTPNDDQTRKRNQEFENGADQALDSMLRVLGRSENDGTQFAENVISKLRSDSGSSRLNSELGSTEVESFFGNESLLTQSLALNEQGSGCKVSDQVNRSNREPKNGWMARAFLIAASIAVLSAISGFWFLVPEKTPAAGKDERNDVADRDGVATSAGEEHDSVVLTDQKRLGTEPTLFVPERLPRQNDQNSGSKIAPRDLLQTPSLANGRNPGWNLALNFDLNGVGLASVNGQTLDAEFEIRDADLVLARVRYEVVRRFRFLSPMLASPWEGAIQITTPNINVDLEFQSLDQMENRISEARKKIEEPVSFAGNENLNDDVPRLLVVNEIMEQTESLLLQRARQDNEHFDSVFSEPNRKSGFARFKNYRTIGPEEFEHYLKTGQLSVPKPSEAFLANTSVQKSNAEDLRKQLAQSVPEVNMFEDIHQFRETERLILSQTEYGRLQVQRVENEDRMTPLIEQNRTLVDSRAIKDVQKKIGRLARANARIAEEINQMAKLPQEARAPVEPLVKQLPNRPDLLGLPFVMGDQCHLSESNASTLDVVSKNVGQMLSKFDRFGSRDFDQHNDQRLWVLKRMINRISRGPNADQGLGTLDQMLQMEKPALRIELVKVLREANTRTACSMLARYAKYDLDPSVRIAATDALSCYPGSSYRHELIAGLSYPWLGVAQHSVDALVRLNDIEAIPELVQLLQEPDPRAPQRNGRDRLEKRELVAINHMKNCTLCHADSQNQLDPGRGHVQRWGRALPQKYYQLNEGAMVRADITYLRQDFSVIQQVKDAFPWPENQRFDYVVKTSPLTSEQWRKESERFRNRPNEYHTAIGMALRMLTGMNPSDDRYETWQAIMVDAR